jgi:hypothetical protein
MPRSLTLSHVSPFRELCKVLKKIAFWYIALIQNQSKGPLPVFDPYQSRDYYKNYPCRRHRQRSTSECLPFKCGIKYYTYMYHTYHYMIALAREEFRNSENTEITFLGNWSLSKFNVCRRALKALGYQEDVYHELCLKWMYQVEFSLTLKRDLTSFKVEFFEKPELNYRVDIGDRYSRYRFVKVCENGIERNID